mgnify:FL=1
MNKLEQAIRKTSGGDYLYSSSGEKASFIEEIEKMKTSYLMTRENLDKNRIIYPDFKNSELVNSFRELRTLITSKSSNNVVMVTSTRENSGVSFFSRNLAVATAFDLSKTSILVDCNGRGGGVDEIFNLNLKPGVSWSLSSK